MSLGNLNILARLRANVIGANMMAKILVAKWQNSRVIDWKG